MSGVLTATSHGRVVTSTHYRNSIWAQAFRLTFAIDQSVSVEASSTNMSSVIRASFADGAIQSVMQYLELIKRKNAIVSYEHSISMAAGAHVFLAFARATRTLHKTIPGIARRAIVLH